MVAATAARLPALLVSTSVLPKLIAPGSGGHLHSVYRRSANLLCAGELITLVLSEAGVPPNGLVVGKVVDFPSLGLAPEMAVIGRASEIVFPDAGLSVSLADAVPWSPRLVVRLLTDPDNRLATGLRLAAELSADRAPVDGFGPILRVLAPELGMGRCSGSRHAETAPALLQLAGNRGMPPLCRRALPAMSMIVRALQTGDLGPAVAVASAIVGLGVGLTPSGDDFLLGLSAALMATGHPGAIPFAAGCAGAASSRTTLVSATLLAYAARGQYGGRIHGLMAAILAGEEVSLRSQVAATLGWGATSGADCLVGVLLGISLARRSDQGVGAGPAQRGLPLSRGRGGN